LAATNGLGGLAGGPAAAVTTVDSLLDAHPRKHEGELARLCNTAEGVATGFGRTELVSDPVRIWSERKGSACPSGLRRTGAWPNPPPSAWEAGALLTSTI
jgi:hypothetical protein